MADISEVLSALVLSAQSAIYPQGTGSASVSGSDVMIYAGWPLPSKLDADMAAGKAQVSVWARPEVANLRKYRNRQASTDIGAVNILLHAAVTSTTVTYSGALTGVTAVVLIVNGAPFVYPIAPGDGLAQVATGLAALINAGGITASSAGPVITLSAHSIVARATATGVLRNETRRQERTMQVSVWAPSGAARDLLAKALDDYFETHGRIATALGETVVVRYKSEAQIDEAQTARVYRRDLMLTAEFPTSHDLGAYTVTVPVLGVSTL